MRLWKHPNGIYYYEIDRNKRVSLRTRDFDEAKKKYDEVKGDNVERLYQKLTDRINHTKINKTTGKGFVYFIEGEGMGLIKIGFTLDVRHRLIIMQTNSPVKLKVLGLMCGCSIKTESEIHAKFAKTRSRGEWFNITDSLLWFIKHNKDPENANYYYKPDEYGNYNITFARG